MALADLPLVASDRKITGIQLGKVFHHFGKLIDDKEATEHVFHIIEAMKSKKSQKQAEEFILSTERQRFIANDVNIPEMLDNHENWADLPENSVGAHYIAFMKREGLTAKGLVEESHKFAPPETRPNDLTEWYYNRLRDTHDLFHVLTGYGRDALGEEALLGFSYEQNHNYGILFIAFAGARQVKKTTGTKAPLYAAVREGKRLGKAAAKLAHLDIEKLMREDIDEARKRLNIGVPVIYRQCLAQLKEEGFAEEDLGLSLDQPQAQAA